ncbi:MAG: hypothetical protein ACHP7K_11820 [Actinomycetales bacterium]
MADVGDLEVRPPDRVRLARYLAALMRFLAALCWLGVFAAASIITTGSTGSFVLLLLRCLSS